jgi:L-glyceraldehyde 3-phosphate reductase
LIWEQEIVGLKHIKISNNKYLWKDSCVTSVLIGASSVEQLKQNILAINNIDFTDKELQDIEAVLKKKY